MAALIWSHFLFNFLNLNGHPYLVALILSFLLFFFFFFFFGKKRCLTWDSNPGPLDLQSGCLLLDHHHTHHHHNLKAVFKLIFFFFFFEKKVSYVGFEPGTS